VHSDLTGRNETANHERENTMYYTQSTLEKINQDVVTYFSTLKDAKKAAKRQAKDADYSNVWYGGSAMEARVKVK
jgi:hypothetical protein